VWRQPGLVAVASKLAASAAPHKPIKFLTPSTSEPKSGPNPWTEEGLLLPEPLPLAPPSAPHVVAHEDSFDQLDVGGAHVSGIGDGQGAAASPRPPEAAPSGSPGILGERSDRMNDLMSSNKDHLNA